MRILLLFCTFVLVALGDERPTAAPGFKWMDFEGIYCDIQVPNGWKNLQSTAGLAQAVRISPEPVILGRGIDVGFTINTAKVKSQAEWKRAMALVGEIMATNRDATPNPIQSSVNKEKDMLVMIIEGERFISGAPQPGKKYHVRTVVRAFAEYGMIFMYSFGAPVDQWDEAWKTGKVMMNPLWFHFTK